MLVSPFSVVANLTAQHIMRGLDVMPSRKPYLALATGGRSNIDEAARINLTLMSAALGRLWLLLGLNLGGLRLDLAYKTA